MLTALVLLCSMTSSDCRNIAEAPDQTELPFICLKYGQEEAAKHQVPDGKYVKVQCVHKSVPRIIEWSRPGPPSCSLSVLGLS
jgi:hypothetical protein